LPVGTPAGAAAPEPFPPTSETVLAGSTLSREEREQVAAQLQRDERLVWADKPDARVAFFRGCIFAVAFVFPAAVVGGILVLLGTSGGALMGVLLGLIAAGFLVCAFALPLVLRWRTGRSFYAFTTKRVLAWPCDWLGRARLVVYEPSTVSGVQLERVSTD